jgi:hypothetical protein
MFVVRKHRTWWCFGAPYYQIGWLNSAGYGPIGEYGTRKEAEAVCSWMNGNYTSRVWS